ncbi:MAG: hypothetical protein IGR80_09835 [Synechococcales cyanobacterium K44_A2020_017]|nr:hypothetical protein [Synechococcales cyanobacterium K32_A2020_035]MBF2095042.1 hypothetical protein [Synechococcales cyanobacterium K44_A2020_017]
MKLKNIYLEPLLSLLLLTDLGFIVAHVIASLLPVPNDMFFLDRDRSYPEMFQYIKFFWIAIVLLYLGLKQGKSYLAWSSFFTFLLLDDYFGLHETGGGMIASQLGFTRWLALRPVDYGEMVYAASAALLFFVIIALTYKRGSAEFKRFSQRILWLMAIFVFFAVGVDMVHVMTTSFPQPLISFLLENTLAIVEDGGEMMVLSLIVYYIFAQIPKNEDKSQKYYPVRSKEPSIH